MPLFDPKRIIYHDYGGSPENTPGVFNPYHSLVFPSGDVRHRNPSAPYNQAAPHAFLLNNSSLGLSYAGPVGSQPTPAGMRALQGEYEKMQRAFPGLPGVGHGEAGPMATASSRDREEGSWRNRVTDLSQTPETGLPQLSLLGGPPPDDSQPAVASAASAAPTPTSTMGAPKMPMNDAAPNQQPGYFDKLMVNPMFMAGLSILGTQPGGNWGPNAANAASSTLKTQMANTEFQREQQQKALTSRIWGEAFPGGQPNPNHPLTKGLPPDLLASVYALGPDAGVPQLSQLAMKGAMGRQALALQQQQGEQMARAIFGDAGMPGQQPQPGQPTQQPPQMAPQPPLAQQAALPSTQPTALPGTVLGGAAPQPMPPPPQPPLQAAAGAPYSFQGGQRSGASGEAVLNDPQLRKIMYGHIMAGKPDEAMKAYQSALEKAQAPRLAGETTLAQKQAEELAAKPQARATTSALIEGLDRMEALATKVHGDKHLGKATGMWSQPQSYAASITMPWRNTRPGSGTADVEADMKTLTSQVGLNTLQALKEASKTGAGLGGNTSDRDVALLQTAITNINDPSISKEKYRENLRIIMTHSKRIRERMLGAWQDQYGEAFREPGGTTPPGYTEPRPITIKVNGKQRKVIKKEDGYYFAD